MDIASNFKAALRGDRPLYGMFVAPASPAVVELAGYAGFDFVIIDTEHGPAGLETLENMLRAAEAAGLAGLVRVPSGSAPDILHALDCGAAGILVPHVASVETARQVVGHAYYPPRGRRGISTMARAARYSLGGAAYIANQHTRTTVLAMIEDAEALPLAADIAAVEGVDGVFVGPSDLSASMGHPGNPAHPEVVAALSGLWTGLAGRPIVTTARSAADAKALAGKGIRAIAFNATQILASGLTQLRAAL